MSEIAQIADRVDSRDGRTTRKSHRFDVRRLRMLTHAATSSPIVSSYA